METYDVGLGTNKPTGHLSVGTQNMRNATKLSLMMYLSSECWEASGDTDILVAGAQLSYRRNISKSRWYFVAMAESTEIFSRILALPSGNGDDEDDRLPYISHTMNEPYYKARSCLVRVVLIMCVSVRVYGTFVCCCCRRWCY